MFLYSKVLPYRVAITCDPLSSSLRIAISCSVSMTPIASSPAIDRPAKAKTPRCCARQRIEALVYVELGSENGGFPINISEDGMAFQGIRPLDINQEISVTFKLDGIDESVTAAAKIVWLTESRKGGGLRFIDLPEASRHLINNWISLQKQAGNPEESPKAATTHVEAKVLPSTPAVPLVADPSDSSPQTITIVATQP